MSDFKYFKVVNVNNNSIALKAGLKKGHHILEINGESIQNISIETIVERVNEFPNYVDLLVVNFIFDKFTFLFETKLILNFKKGTQFRRLFKKYAERN